MEQIVLVPASVYNKSVTAQSVTKQEFPKYKAEQPPTYQIDSLKRDINKKLFDKTDTLIHKFYPVPASSFQIRKQKFWMVLILECYFQTLLYICVEKTQTFQTFTLLYSTLLEYHPL